MSAQSNHHRQFDAYSHQSRRPSVNSFSLTGHLDPVVQKHLRRVYTTLFAALLAAAAGSLITLELYARRQQWIANLSTYLTLPVLLAFSFQAPHSKWRAPLFYAFAFVDGCAAAPLISLVASIDRRIPSIAFIGASLIFACCTMSAIMARRRSYLFLGSFCSSALLGLVFVSLISSVWPTFISYSLIMYGGLLLFLCFTLYDTQKIIERCHDGERDHLQHALELLIDFIAIFKRLLIIMAKNSTERQRREDEDRRRSK